MVPFSPAQPGALPILMVLFCPAQPDAPPLLTVLSFPAQPDALPRLGLPLLLDLMREANCHQTMVVSW